MAKTLKVLLKFAVPVAILGFLFWNMDPEKLQQVWQQDKNYPLLIAALIVALAAFGFSFFRWCILVRCQGIQLSVLEAFRLGAIGFLFSFLSPGSVGGDLFKAVFLARRARGKTTECFASVFVDRGIGMFGLLLLVATVLLVSRPTGSTPEHAIEMARVVNTTLIMIGIGTVLFGILMLGGRWVDDLIESVAKRAYVGPILGKIGRSIR
ncbi:MAG: lysylphosphatidylglycerol synthase transmembrane domain-containing protein, partial [Planctomycetota bacterium]